MLLLATQNVKIAEVLDNYGRYAALLQNIWYKQQSAYTECTTEPGISHWSGKYLRWCRLFL